MGFRDGVEGECSWMKATRNIDRYYRLSIIKDTEDEVMSGCC